MRHFEIAFLLSFFTLFSPTLNSQCLLLSDSTIAGNMAGLSSSYTFNSSNQLLKIEFTDSGLTAPNRMDTIIYDSSGKFIKKEKFMIGAPNPFETLTYSYDTADNISRILTATSAGDQWAYDMSYDSSGTLRSIQLDSSSMVGNVQTDLDFLNMQWTAGTLSSADLVFDFGLFIDTLEVSLNFDNKLNLVRMIPPETDELVFYMSQNNFLTVSLDENEVVAPRGTIILSQSYTYNSNNEVDTLTIDSTISDPTVSRRVFKYNCTVGLEEFDSQASDFLLYPNPAREIAYISLQSKKAYSLHLYDLNGKLIYSRNKLSGNRIELNLSNYPDGLYFIQLISEKGSKTKKLILR